MFRSRPNTNTTAATVIQGSIRPPEYTRQQHLDSYLQDDTLSKSTRRVSTDDSTYDTVFQTVDQWTLILRVHLPPPSSAASTYVRPPAMTLAGIKARHNWLDSRMQVVGFTPITTDANWRDARMLLGTAVLQVIQHLQLHPPEVLEIVDRSLQSIQRRTLPTSTVSSTMSKRSTSPVRTSTAAPPPSSSQHEAAPAYESIFAEPPPPAPAGPSLITLPPVPSRFDFDSNPNSLQELLDDEIVFLNYCNSLEYTRALVKHMEDAIEDNRKAAQTNVQQQDELLQLHQRVTELEESLQQRVEEFQRLEMEQDRISQPPAVKELQRVLQRSKKQAFEESETLAEEWDGQNVQTFLNQFVKQRKVHHIRAAKLELLLNDPTTRP